ncbi:MAG: carboxypeptidase regulatory-like domain-containing protein [Thermoanaerobaculia bacterium]|nr:carboxypeptidase regulatory-like domain-containing protein [Thermoanaerobaculia bacterium]
MLISWRRVVPLLAILALFAAPWAAQAQSQATTGVIEGTVSDDTGAALPGANVVLKNTATNFELATTSDGRGRFRGVALPLGPYKVTVSLAGFATLVRDGLELQVGQTIRVPVTMKLATVEEEITVTAEAPQVDTARVENSTLITRKELAKLPNNGRNFLELTKLTPGVAIVQGPDGDELTINGQKGIQNNISVDGADFNNPFFGEQRGGQRPAFTFNLDAVQEFVVVPDGAPAEFGRSSSGFVNVVTKSGTNDYSGTAHLYFKNDSLSTRAERPDGTLEPEFDSEQIQVGFTLGGPLRQDKLFFFTAVDFQDGSTTKQNDPARIEPRVVAALASLGSPNENGPIERSNDAFVFLGKIDWQAADNHLVTLRATTTDSSQVNGTFDVDSWGRSANATEDDNSYSITGTVISNVAADKFNELRFQYAKEERPRPYDGPINPRTGRPLPDTAFDFGRQYRFGMPFFIPVEYNDQRWQLNENLTWLTENHTVKAGLEFNRTEAFQTFIGFANGRFIFDSTDGFLNYLRNPRYVTCSNGTSSETGVCPAGTSITGPVLLYLQQAGVGNTSVRDAGTQTITQDEPAVFLQDTWQPREGLTLQYGLRWEAQIQPDPITPPDEVFYAPFIGQTRNGQKFPSNGKIPSDKDLWQPRLGLAWDPKGDAQTVIRASAGLYYARVPGLVLASSRSTNGSRGQTLFRNSALGPILGPPPAYGDLITNVGAPFRPDVFVFDEDFQNPRTTAVALAVERQLTPRLSGLVKYNYADTDHLTRFVNRNDPLLGSPWSTGLGADGQNGIGALTVVESSAKSRYNGITLGLTGRHEKVQFQTYYTYSKDESDDDNERDPFSFRYAKVTDLDAEYGLSDRDQKHRANAWVLWRAPWGIDVNARYSYRSAQPKSITATGADAATPQDRINPDGSVTERNLGRKDNEFSSLDLRLAKTFQVGNLELEGIIDVFNVFNEKNLRRPEVTSLVFNFDGTVTSGVGDPRQVQVGIRLLF